MRWRNVVLLGLTAVAACTDDRRPPATDVLSPCLVHGIERPAECGHVTVKVDPTRDDTWDLRVVRVPARAARRSREPLFLLAGGPGQAATVAYPQLWSAFARVSEGRDIVMFDARGTGQSAPLDCPRIDDPSFAFRADAVAEAARRCVSHVETGRIEAYSTEAMVRDLDAVRSRLGYETIDLLGASYGTRVALAYASQFPDRARLLVLDGVVPPELALGGSFGRDADSAIDSILADCESDRACREAFPALRTAYRRHLDGLDGKASVIQLEDPGTKASISVKPTRGAVASLVRSLAYSPELAALLPSTLAEVVAGRYQPLLGQAIVLSRSAEVGMSLGLLYSIACAEDVPRISDSEREAELASTLGATLVDDFRAACAAWPVRPRPLEGLGTPLATPTLLLSGGADPATPPRWAESLRTRLTRSAHVVVPQAGHGVWLRGCVSSLVEDFLSHGTPERIDGGCAAEFRRPPFFLDREGPLP